MSRSRRRWAAFGGRRSRPAAVLTQRPALAFIAGLVDSDGAPVPPTGRVDGRACGGRPPPLAAVAGPQQRYAEGAPAACPGIGTLTMQRWFQQKAWTVALRLTTRSAALLGRGAQHPRA